MAAARLGPARSAALAALLLAAAAAGQAADSGTLAVSAVVLSRSNCKFDSNGTLAMVFDPIDPSSGSDATKTVTTSFTCNGSANVAAFLVTAENGMHYAGGTRRLLRGGSTPAEYMAYSVAITPSVGTSNKGAPQTIAITGTIAPAAFQNASAGSYSDTVRITLTP